MDTKEVDYVHLLTYRSNKRLETLHQLTVAERSAALQKLSPYIQQSILKQLKIGEIVEMLDHMDMQHARLILTRIQDSKKREIIIQRLKSEVREKIDYFLRFHPKATLALVNFNYLFLDSTLTIKEAAELISEHYEETARYPEVLVHVNGELVGGGSTFNNREREKHEYS